MPDTSVNTLLKNKKEAKKSLAKELGIALKKPLLGVFLDNELSADDQKMVADIFEALGNLDIEVVVLADTNMDILEKEKVLDYSRLNRSRLLMACDIALALDFNDVEEMLLNGVIPISYKRSELEDYNPNSETGNSFIYDKRNPWSIFATMVRATENFKFPYDWKHIVLEGLNSIKD